MKSCWSNLTVRKNNLVFTTKVDALYSNVKRPNEMIMMKLSRVNGEISIRLEKLDTELASDVVVSCFFAFERSWSTASIVKAVF